MQDWEWEVADPNRIGEFMEAYKSGNLDEDELFTLAETIIQSFVDLDADLKNNQSWAAMLLLIEKNIDIHIYSVWYWADPEEEEMEHLFSVASDFRKLLGRYKDKFAL